MTVLSEFTRVYEGRDIPAPGIWNIDPAHSDIEFSVRHMMISKVRGRFREFSGTLQIAPDPLQSRVEAVVHAASIDTGDEDRDRHLRSPDFLDVERYPHITFRSTAIEPTEGDRWRVIGDLTIKDVTRPVALGVELGGAGIDPWGNPRTGFVGRTEINREEFGISWNHALEAGGFLVGKVVSVEIDAEAVRQAEPTADSGS
jgi:polyisoprenoid-binding protein YceI